MATLDMSTRPRALVGYRLTVGRVRALGPKTAAELILLAQPVVHGNVIESGKEGQRLVSGAERAPYSRRSGDEDLDALVQRNRRQLNGSSDRLDVVACAWRIGQGPRAVIQLCRRTRGDRQRDRDRSDSQRQHPLEETPAAAMPIQLDVRVAA